MKKPLAAGAARGVLCETELSFLETFGSQTAQIFGEFLDVKAKVSRDLVLEDPLSRASNFLEIAEEATNNVHNFCAFATNAALVAIFLVYDPDDDLIGIMDDRNILQIAGNPDLFHDVNQAQQQRPVVEGKCVDLIVQSEFTSREHVANNAVALFSILSQVFHSVVRFNCHLLTFRKYVCKNVNRWRIIRKYSVRVNLIGL